MSWGPTWTTERIDTAKALWAKNWTASQIGTEMGISRNAVLGKLHRENVPGRAPRPVQPRKRRRSPTRPAPGNRLKSINAEPLPIDFAPETSPFACTIEHLTETTCRWPMGVPAYDMPYCGRECVECSSYCIGHYRIAFLPTKWRR